MRQLVWMAALGLIGCTSGPAPKKKKPPEPQDTGTIGTTGLPVGTTGTPTGTVVGTFDCSLPPAGAPLPMTTYGIHTQEDFDFSLGGYLIYQSGIAVVGTNKLAEETVLSAGAAGDPRGVHGLSDGRIAIMSPWDGSIKIADPATGGLTVLAGSLNTPNGVDIGANDRIYFTTYGEVGWMEVDGSNYQLIHSWGGAGSTPNGTVLSEDEQRLTVAAPNWDGTDFVTFDRTGPDTWGAASILHSVQGFFSALDEDVCGNLYTVEYNSGKVIRIYPDGTPEVIAQLSGGGGWGFSAMRFGPGHNGWERDHLYISKRATEVYDLTIGIPGRRHPTTPP